MRESFGFCSGTGSVIMKIYSSNGEDDDGEKEEESFAFFFFWFGLWLVVE